uniref:Uncharacterized protein n=1 Tax=Knipowitschia caucasica TaxID=637954 RepID=A0AAV2LSB9_KNICA
MAMSVCGSSHSVVTPRALANMRASTRSPRSRHGVRTAPPCPQTATGPGPEPQDHRIYIITWSMGPQSSPQGGHWRRFYPADPRKKTRAIASQQCSPFHWNDLHTSILCIIWAISH